MIDVLEHLDEELRHELLLKAEKWAKKKVIINSPNEFIEQTSLDGNDLRKHLSGWDYGKMREMGYEYRGLAEFKFLRQKVETHTTMDNNLLANIKFHPKLLWFGVSAIFQPLLYRLLSLVFSLFSVKEYQK